MIQIHGTVAAGFEPVREAFLTNFTEGEDVGAAVAVYRGGEQVVDLWAGVADVETGRAWTRDTAQLVFSTSKGVTATVAHLLAQRGEIDLDAPVARYWPEFAAEGKQDIPVRWLLTHQAGLPAPKHRVPLDWLLKWDPIVEMLAGQAPEWEPGTEHGYHGVTYGWLIGEVVRRATGRTLGTVLAEDIAKPLGLDLWIGTPESEDHRVGRFVAPEQARPPEPGVELPPEMRKIMEIMADRDSLTMRALAVTAEEMPPDSEVLRRAEVPAIGAVGTANAFARLYASTVGEVDGFRLLSEETIDRARAPQVSGLDKVMMLPNSWALGYIPYSPPAQGAAAVRLIGPGSFGHGGYGGSLAFGDVEHQIGFGYVQNKIHAGLTGEGVNSGRLVEALSRSLGV